MSNNTIIVNFDPGVSNLYTSFFHSTTGHYFVTTGHYFVNHLPFFISSIIYNSPFFTHLPFIISLQHSLRLLGFLGRSPSLRLSQRKFNSFCCSYFSQIIHKNVSFKRCVLAGGGIAGDTLPESDEDGQHPSQRSEDL
jgi:hypothetical protein